jgi:AraC-like DNA-binding protein
MEQITSILTGSILTISCLLFALVHAGGSKQPADRWLKLWFLFFAIGASLIFLSGNVSDPALIVTTLFGNAVFMALIPCLYLYALSITNQPSSRPILHFSLPIINIFIEGVMFLTGNIQVVESVVFFTGSAVYFSLFLVPASSLILFVYLLKARRLIADRTLGASQKKDKQDLIWVGRWILSTILIVVLSLLLFLSQLVLKVQSNLLEICGLFFLSFQLSYVGYSGLKRTRYFLPRGKTPEPKSNLLSSPQDVDEFHMALKESGAYLESNLTLRDLCQAIGWSEIEVSRVVGVDLKKGISKALNRARVEHAKKLISDPNNSSVRLLTLGYDSGFGSKSAFNAEFHNIAGMTPSQFKHQTLSVN